jgi:hypothetical protein
MIIDILYALVDLVGSIQFNMARKLSDRPEIPLERCDAVGFAVLKEGNEGADRSQDGTCKSERNAPRWGIWTRAKLEKWLIRRSTTAAVNETAAAAKRAAIGITPASNNPRALEEFHCTSAESIAIEAFDLVREVEQETHRHERTSEISVARRIQEAGKQMVPHTCEGPFASP